MPALRPDNRGVNHCPTRLRPGTPSNATKWPIAAIGSQQDILRKREQDFRAGVEKLFQLTSALREELKTTTTTDVLNVKMYKRLQEVENWPSNWSRKPRAKFASLKTG